MQIVNRKALLILGKKMANAIQKHNKKYFFGQKHP